MPDSELVSAYDFELPERLIAQRPARERTDARLLVLENGRELQHRVFADLAEFLRPGDLLVRNRTRVFPARLLGRRSGGGKTEFLLVRELSPNRWECLARPCSHLKEGKTVEFGAGELRATVLGKAGSGHIEAEFSCREGLDFWGAIDRLGQVPLPPYIEREGAPGTDDLERYQTVYAKERGAVAAPTAGLHFTEGLFEALGANGVEVADLVLHVGPGTFRPVKAERICDHVMDVERYFIPEETAKAVARAKARGARVIAVGTTSTRALESAADESGTVRPGEGETGIFIHPPYRFKTVDALVTNFHLPRSTLLMLVSALAGKERVLAAYAEAVRQEYRFYSYGDAMLVLP